jgi:hypothetical protein
MSLAVMAGLGPATHASARVEAEGVDGRNKCGHDESGSHETQH